MNKIKSYFDEINLMMRSGYWFMLVALGIVYGNILYFLVKSDANFSDLLSGGANFHPDKLYLVFIFLATVLVVLAGILYRKTLAPRSFLLAVVFALSIFGLYNLGNLPYGDYYCIFLFALSLSLYLYLTVLSPLVSYFENRKDKIVYLVIAVAVLFSLYSIVRYAKFEAHAYDLGLYINAFYKMSHLELSNTVKGINNLFGDHFNPILVPLSMLLWIFPFTVTPLVAQALIVALGGIPLYLLARDLLKSKTAAIFVCLAYFFFLGLQMAIDFDFHTATLAPTFFFLSFYLAYKKKWLWYFVSLIPLLMVKENISLHVLFLGLYLMFSKKTFKYGIATAFVGAVWFVIVTQFVMPAVSAYGFRYFEYTQALGSSPAEAIKTIIANPLHVVHFTFNHELKITTLLNLFFSFGFVPLFSPATAFLAIPMIGENLWNDNISRWFGFHYNFAPAVAFAIASVFGIGNLSKILRRQNDKLVKTAIAVFIFICSFGVAAKGDMALLKLLNPSFYRFSPAVRDTYEAMKVVPKNASVFAQDSIVPHFATRDKVYNFPYNSMPERFDSDYVVMSVGLSAFPFTDEGKVAAEIKSLMTTTHWRVYKRVNGAFVLKKNYKPSPEEEKQALDYLEKYL